MQHAMPGTVMSPAEVPAGTCFLCTSEDGTQVAIAIATSSGDLGFIVLNAQAPVLYHVSALEQGTVYALPEARILPDLDLAKVRFGQHRGGAASCALYQKDDKLYVVASMREDRVKVVNVTDGQTASVTLEDAVHFASWRIALIGLDGYPETIASFQLAAE